MRKSAWPPSAALLALTPFAFSGDWENSGGNAGRNGATAEVGPEWPSFPAYLWGNSTDSLKTWQPVTEDGRLFVVRQEKASPGGLFFPDDSPIVAYDLETGAVLWEVDLVVTIASGTTWIAGVRDGRVFVSRNAYGSPDSPLYALDAATGHVLWTSEHAIQAGPYDGVVFAPNGDPILAGVGVIQRIDAATGATVWTASRICASNAKCGAAIHGDSVYVADMLPWSGQALKRFELATGAFLYESGLIPGLPFPMHNTPMVGPDGTLYLNRVQGDPGLDTFFAFQDTGAAFVEKWHVPANYNESVEYAVGPAGNVYMMGPGHALQRLDPATGAVLGSFPLDHSGMVRMAVDALGRLYVSDGDSTPADWDIYCFDADLTLRWKTSTFGVGIPALGRDGSLVLADESGVTVLRNPLAQDLIDVSASAGGTQTLKLHVKIPPSADKPYWVVGSASGTSPGLAVGAVTLPLNPDPYMIWTITHPNTPVLEDTLGALDAAGRAVAKINVPAGVPLTVPLTLNHAFLVVDFATATASFASNASVLRLVP